MFYSSLFRIGSGCPKANLYWQCGTLTVDNKLPTLEDSQCEFVVLRSCLSVPKMTYLMRTTIPTQSALRSWKNFDGLQRDSLCRILGSNLGDTAWLQAQLPLSAGGMGLRGAQSHASAAYLGSVLLSEGLVGQILSNKI